VLWTQLAQGKLVEAERHGRQQAVAERGLIQPPVGFGERRRGADSSCRPHRGDAGGRVRPTPGAATNAREIGFERGPVFPGHAGEPQQRLADLRGRRSQDAFERCFQFDQFDHGLVQRFLF
jgi:hypothetical protein